MLSLDAPAKINVGLRILGRRPDGHHDLETLFLAVGLLDRLEFSPGDGASIELEVLGADVGPLEDNLVLRAARLFGERTGSPVGGRFRLEKHIPAGAGLGGGSSDAGAAIRLLDAAAGTGLTPEDRAAIGGEIGADVAFFAAGAAFARGEGRGERLTPLPAPTPRRIVVGVPPVHVATGPAYGALARRRAAAGGVVPAPLLPREVSGDWAGLERLLENDFEAGVREDHPPVASLLDAMRAHLEGPVLLSGSGGAVFGFPADGAAVDVGGLESAAPGARFHVVHTLDRMPAITG